MLGDTAYNDGVVGIALGGALEVEALVAQGCRPVGRPAPGLHQRLLLAT